MLDKKYYIYGNSKFLFLLIIISAFYLEWWKDLEWFYLIIAVIMLLYYFYVLFAYIIVTKDSLCIKLWGIILKKCSFQEYIFEGNGKKQVIYDRDNDIWFDEYYTITAIRKRDGKKKFFRFYKSGGNDCAEVLQLLKEIAESKSQYVEPLVTVLYKQMQKKMHE